VLGVEDWAEIRRLRRAEQMSISQIARVLGVIDVVRTARHTALGPGVNLTTGSATNRR
jgi:hypothetical protein